MALIIQKIEVDNACRVWFCADAPKLCLDRLQQVQQAGCVEFSCNRCDRIDEPRLGGGRNGLAAIPTGACAELNAPGFQLNERGR